MYSTSRILSGVKHPIATGNITSDSDSHDSSLLYCYSCTGYPISPHTCPRATHTIIPPPCFLVSILKTRFVSHPYLSISFAMASLAHPQRHHMAPGIPKHIHVARIYPHCATQLAPSPVHHHPAHDARTHEPEQRAGRGGHRLATRRATAAQGAHVATAPPRATHRLGHWRVGAACACGWWWAGLGRGATERSMVVHAGWTGAVRAVYVENVPLDAGTFDGWCLVGSFWQILFMYHVY